VKPLVFIPHHENGVLVQGKPLDRVCNKFATHNLWMPQPITQAEFELRVNRLRWSLLLVWASVTFCVAFFARSFDGLFFDRPVGFWMAAQGSVLIFLIITWVYALWVNAWERLINKS
jgi:putative solute:sodium symporter small subunit